MNLNQQFGNTSYFFKNRISFIHCLTPDNEIHLKTNTFETDKIIEYLKTINSMQWQENGTTIGIITPFRAQIAFIRQRIEEEGLMNSSITIDTVERYQGGARDIIIVSLCANKKSMLKSITSINKEGIDRKLNVALTRAKSQIIILGNRNTLNHDPTYADLINQYEI